MTSYIMGNLSSPQGFDPQKRSPLTNLTRESAISTRCYVPPIYLRYRKIVFYVSPTLKEFIY